MQGTICRVEVEPPMEDEKMTGDIRTEEKIEDV